jgi:hypothetical protein
VADPMVVTIAVREPEAEAERLDRLADDLRDALNEAGVGGIGRPSGGPAPAGTRGDLETVGAVLVTAQTSVELLRVIVSTVREWLGRSRAPERTSSIRVRIGDNEIEADGVTPEQQQKLIDAFLSAGGGDDRA